MTAPDPHLQDLIQRLSAERLIVPDGPGQYAFRHSLTRDAVYTTLLRVERQTLHRTVGETLEGVYPDLLDAHLDDLAYHFFHAGAWDKAAQYGGRAAQKAQSMYAPREAIQHCTQAIEAAAMNGRPVPPGLHRTRGQAYDLLGEFDHALADFERERQAAQALGDRLAEWQSLVDLGFLWAARDYGRTGEYLREALELARLIGDGHALATSLNRVGNWYGNIEQPDQALRYHREALEICQAANDRPGMAETLDLLGLTTTLTGDLRGQDYYQQAIALFRELDNRPGLASALANNAERGLLFLSCMAVLPPIPAAQIVAEMEEAVQIAHAIGWRSGEAYARLNQALALTAAGDYGPALEQSQRGYKIASDIEHQQWCTYAHCGIASIYAELLAGDLSRRHAEQGLPLAVEIGSLNFVRFASAAVAEACLLQGNLSRAEFILGMALGQSDLIAGIYPEAADLQAKGLTATIGARLCVYNLAALALARRKAGTALAYVELLRDTAPNFSSYGPGAMPRLTLLQARILLALGRAAEAQAPLRAALDNTLERGGHGLAWQLHAALAQIYEALGNGTAAAEQQALAQAGIAAIAARLPDDELRENFLRRATP